MASVILLYTNDKHEISKEACKLLNSNLENSGHKIFMVPFKNFRKTHLSRSSLILFLVDIQHPKELQKVEDYLDKKPPNFLLGIKFSILAFGDPSDKDKEKEKEKEKDKGKDKDNTKDITKFRSKCINLGADDIFGDELILLPGSKRNRNSQAALMYSPNILQELHKIDASLVGTTGKRKNSIFAPVSWALLDPSSSEFKQFTEKFRREAPISNQTWGENSMENCFLGNEAVDWICRFAENGHAITRDQAVGIGQKMLQSGVFSHITNELAFKDKPILYKFPLVAEKPKKWVAPPEWQ